MISPKRASNRGIYGGVAAAALLCAALTAHGEQKTVAGRAPDAGRFVLTSGGQKLGVCSFKFDATGGCTSTSDLTVGGQSQKLDVAVTYRSGTLAGFSASTGATNRFNVTVSGGQAQISINGGPAKTQRLATGLIPFGNYSPHLVNGLLAAYDQKRGGSQSFKLVTVEGIPASGIALLDGKLTRKETTNKTIVGKSLTVTSYVLSVGLGGRAVDMNVFASPDGRLLSWNVPFQSYSAVRAGYEALK